MRFAWWLECKLSASCGPTAQDVNIIFSSALEYGENLYVFIVKVWRLLTDKDKCKKKADIHGKRWYHFCFWFYPVSTTPWGKQWICVEKMFRKTFKLGNTTLIGSSFHDRFLTKKEYFLRRNLKTDCNTLLLEPPIQCRQYITPTSYDIRIYI